MIDTVSSMNQLPPLLLFGLIGLLGFLCQWLAERVKIPAILFLLTVGIALGPLLGVLSPDALFGDLLLPYISLSVAVILFEGALTLSSHELRDVGRPVLRLISVGMLINAIITTLATHYIVGLGWELSALFGAIMVVTGPTVIMPMLKSVRPQPKIGHVLRWEGIVIDPIGALFAVLVYEFVVAYQMHSGFADIAWIFFSTVGVGAAIGMIAGFGFGLLIRNHLIPESIRNYSALAIACFAFALSDTIIHESGLLAVTLAGIILANMRDVNTRSILGFKEDLTVVLVSALFIVLAARIEFSGLISLGWGAVILLLIMQLVARPLNIMVSFFGTDFKWQEKALVAWIGPRGIVAAAVVAVFAIRMESLGYSEASLLVPLAFTIIIGTVFISGLSSRALALKLNVAQPPTQGVIIYGANKFSIEFASALDTLGSVVLLCDTNWDKLRPARLQGINTYHGNPSSKHALQKLQLDHYGIFLGLADHYEANLAQANRFKHEFGERNVFILSAHRGASNPEKNLSSDDFSARFLFAKGWDSFWLGRYIAAGNSIRTSKLSAKFNAAQWREQWTESVPLCWITKAGKLNFVTIDTDIKTIPNELLVHLPTKIKKVPSKAKRKLTEMLPLIGKR